MMRISQYRRPVLLLIAALPLVLFVAMAWQLSRRPQVLPEHTRPISQIRFSPNGHFLVSIDNGGILHLYNVRARKLERVLRLPRLPIATAFLSFSPDSTLLAITQTTTLRLWNTTTGQVRQMPDPPANSPFGIISIAFDRGGKELVVCGGYEKELQMPLPVIRLLQFNLETSRWREVHSFKLSGLSSAALSSGGNLLLLTTEVGSIHIYSVRSGQKLQTLQGKGKSVYIKTIAVSSDEKLVASGGDDGQIKIWNIKTGQLVHTLMGHTGAINNLAYSVSATTLVSGGEDASIRLWDVQSGQVTRTITEPQPVSCVDISSDSTLLADSYDKSTRIRRLK